MPCSWEASSGSRAARAAVADGFDKRGRSDLLDAVRGRGGRRLEGWPWGADVAEVALARVECCSAIACLLHLNRAFAAQYRRQHCNALLGEGIWRAAQPLFGGRIGGHNL